MGSYMNRILAGAMFSIVAVFAIAPSAGWAKTAGVCAAEYKDNKAALKAAGTKKKDFIAACRADQEQIPGPATTQASPPAAPAPTPAPTAPSRAPADPQRTVNAPSATSAPTAANEYQTEAQAKGHCGAGTVVWVNTKSGVYHFAGTHNYGTTKDGAYMCETDTAGAGFRAAKNEKHP
jgi:hypothetical protein